jgi:hypothetical protein
MVTHIHDVIYDHFCKLCVDHTKPHIENFDYIQDKSKFLKACFLNYQEYRASLRLTPLGLTILKHMYECWSWDLTWEDQDLLKKGSVLVRLNNHVKSPYHWDNRKFYVFDSESALEYELVSRSFSAWIAMQDTPDHVA